MEANLEPMVRVRWDGNSSTCYDGRVQDIPRQCVVDEDLNEMAAGSTARFKWGKNARTWRAVVILVDADADAYEAEPAPSVVATTTETERGKGKGKNKTKS